MTCERDGGKMITNPMSDCSMKNSRKTKQTEDRMSELIGLQKSNGIFEISPKDWTESVLDFYAGKYEDVKSSCPHGVRLELWITALAIKIMEVKMSDKKELWELVAQKSKKSLCKTMHSA